MRDPQLLTLETFGSGTRDSRFGWIGDSSGTLLCQWPGCPTELYCEAHLSGDVADRHWQTHLDHVGVAILDHEATRLVFDDQVVTAFFDASHFGCAVSSIEDAGGEPPYRLRWLPAATNSTYTPGVVHEVWSNTDDVRSGHLILGAAVPVVGSEGHTGGLLDHSIQVSAGDRKLWMAGSWDMPRDLTDQVGHGVDFVPGQWAHQIAVIRHRLPPT